MSTKQTDSLGIPSLIKQLKKVHFVYTGDLVTYVYEAATDAKNGDACLLTRYEYVPATSNVANLVEEPSTWNSAWDI